MDRNYRRSNHSDKPEAKRKIVYNTVETKLSLEKKIDVILTSKIRGSKNVRQPLKFRSNYRRSNHSGKPAAKKNCLENRGKQTLNEKNRCYTYFQNTRQQKRQTTAKIPQQLQQEQSFGKTCGKKKIFRKP